jgi:hypothetical protein
MERFWVRVVSWIWHESRRDDLDSDIVTANEIDNINSTSRRIDAYRNFQIIDFEAHIDFDVISGPTSFSCIRLVLSLRLSPPTLMPFSKIYGLYGNYAAITKRCTVYLGSVSKHMLFQLTETKDRPIPENPIIATPQSNRQIESHIKANNTCQSRTLPSFYKNPHTRNFYLLF